MLTLALDTSSDSGSIAVLRDERLIGVVSTSAEETYSSRIFRQLEFLLAELSLQLENFDVFAVNAGPGSFTGLRVGLTLGKAWAEVYGKPIAAVGGLEVVAAQSIAASSEVIVPAIDARRGQVYAGRYRRERDRTGKTRLVAESEDVVIAPQEFLAALRELPAADEVTIATPNGGWLASALAAANGGAPVGIPIQRVSPVFAPMLGLLGREKALRGETVDALRLDANYVRRSDAELNWKGK